MDGLLRRIWSEDQAEDLAEYVLVAVVIGVALIALIQPLESTVSTAFSEATSAL
jgi:Flp pilus assembly pilin Flp